MSSDWRRAALGLGSNLGDRLACLQGAVAALRETPRTRVVAWSSVYESPPMGPVAQGPYLNAAVLIETALTARKLLDLALDIERRFGRVREIRWGPRTLDLDLLWIEDETIDEPGLVVPHPGLGERAFVLLPLAEVYPALRLPDGRSLDRALEECGDHGCVRLPGDQLAR